MNNKVFRIINSCIGILIICIGALIILASIQLNVEQNHTNEEIEKIKQKRNEYYKTGVLDTADITEDNTNEYILRIPSIDSENLVVEGTTKESLKNALGHENDTSLPGESGNCVIAGHRNYTFGKFFNRLNEVEIGDMIYIDTATESFGYRVCEIKTVDPDDVEILDNTDKEILTLYTCTPIYIATQRLVVVAERIL